MNGFEVQKLIFWLDGSVTVWFKSGDI